MRSRWLRPRASDFQRVCSRRTTGSFNIVSPAPLRGPDLWGFCGAEDTQLGEVPGPSAAPGQRQRRGVLPLPLAQVAPQRRVTAPGMSRTHSTRRTPIRRAAGNPPAGKWRVQQLRWPLALPRDCARRLAALVRPVRQAPQRHPPALPRSWHLADDPGHARRQPPSRPRRLG